MSLRAVVLPGLDGTAALRAEFAAMAPAGITAEVVAYPPHLARYDDLAGVIKPHLRPRTDLLIAESFLGPLAVRLARDAPDRIGVVVLIASFVRSPRRLPGSAVSFARYLPPQGRALARLTAPFLVGRGQARTFAPMLAEAMESVTPSVVSQRIRQVLEADERPSLVKLEQPVLYLKATDDRLVPSTVASSIKQRGRDVCVKTIEGPHLLAQAASRQCWQEITRFADDALRSGATKGATVPRPSAASPEGPPAGRNSP